MLKPTRLHIWRDLLWIMGLIVSYALLVRIDLRFFATDGNVAIVWLPSGLGLAALLIGGKKLWPGVLAGAFSAYVSLGRPWLPSIMVAMANVAEVLVAVMLINGRRRLDRELNSLHDYLRLIMGGAAGALVCAVLGVAALWSEGILDSSVLAVSGLTWWMGDLIGIAMLTPLLLVWQRPPPHLTRPYSALEAALCLGLTFLAGQIVFLGWFGAIFREVALAYFMFLFVSWGALRFGLHGTLLIIGMVMTQAQLGTLQRTGFFGSLVPHATFLNLWLYLATLSVVGVSLALSIKQRERLEQALRAAKTMALATVDSLSAQLCVVDMSGTIVVVNQAWKRFHAQNGSALENYGMGENYINICAHASGPGAEDAHLMAAGLQSIFRGEKEEFELEYPCHSPGAQRWFVARARIFNSPGGHVVIAHENITSQKLAQIQLHQFATHLQLSREQERETIARDIHDDLGSVLTSLKLNLSRHAKKQLHPETVGAMLGQVEEAIMTVKKISTDLRPSILDTLGLLDAIEWVLENFSNRTGIECVKILPDHIGIHNNDRVTAIFRILQESLTNVAAHSGATAVFVHLEVNQSGLVMNIHDNGIGIGRREMIKPDSYGLVGMRERAEFLGGKITIVGGPDVGTTITLDVPLDAITGQSAS